MFLEAGLLKYCNVKPRSISDFLHRLMLRLIVFLNKMLQFNPKSLTNRLQQFKKNSKAQLIRSSQIICSIISGSEKRHSYKHLA